MRAPDVAPGTTLGDMQDSSPILITGYGPFPGVEVNPSGQVVQLLSEDPDLLGVQRPVVFAQLPVSYRRTLPLLRELLAQQRPALTVCLGVDSSESQMTLEARAFNELAADSVDVDGQLPQTAEVIPGAQAEWSSRFDVDAAVTALSGEDREGGPLPVRRSDDAGRYLCNAALAVITQEAIERGEGATLFVHIPPLDKVDAPTVISVVAALCQHEEWWG